MAENSDSTVIDSDRNRLVETPPRPKCFGHPRLAIFLTVLLLIITGHVLAIYFIYFQCSSLNCGSLKVKSLNTWGMPALFGSLFKEERMEGIGKHIAEGDYDVFLLQELWMQADHETLAEFLPPDYVMTGFRQLSLSTCDGRASPWGCSGLAVVSKHNFVEVEFNSFTDHGDLAKAAVDGEILARKGVGRVRIMPTEGKNLTVDVFVTHTAADPDPSHGYNNSYYREKQVRELVDSYLSKSTADIVILGGDFNAEPQDSPYQMIKKLMQNCVQELFYKWDEWLKPRFATYGNERNTFSGGGAQKPIIYDYIFHFSAKNISWTNWFDLPWMTLTQNGTSFSLSDHESIESVIYFWK